MQFNLDCTIVNSRSDKIDPGRSPILQAVVVDRPIGYFATTMILASPLTMVQPIDGAIDDDFLADFSKLPDRVWGLR
jgi:hypothetical protein